MKPGRRIPRPSPRGTGLFRGLPVAMLMLALLLGGLGCSTPTPPPAPVPVPAPVPTAVPVPPPPTVSASTNALPRILTGTLVRRDGVEITGQIRGDPASRIYTVITTNGVIRVPYDDLTRIKMDTLSIRLRNQ